MTLLFGVSANRPRRDRAYAALRTAQSPSHLCRIKSGNEGESAAEMLLQ